MSRGKTDTHQKISLLHWLKLLKESEQHQLKILKKIATLIGKVEIESDANIVKKFTTICTKYYVCLCFMEQYSYFIDFYK